MRTNTTSLILAAALIAAPQGFADQDTTLPTPKVVRVEWTDVCKAAAGDPVTVEADGKTLTGFCTSVTVEELVLRTRENRLVTIARSKLSRILATHATSSGLVALRDQTGSNLRSTLRTIFSPSAVTGLVRLPFVVGYSAVALPFCALHDLFHRSDTREIKPR